MTTPDRRMERWHYALTGDIARIEKQLHDMRSQQTRIAAGIADLEDELQERLWRVENVDLWRTFTLTQET